MAIHEPDSSGDARSANLAAQDEQLLAEQGVLREKVGACAERVAHEANHRTESVALDELAGGA